MFSVDGREPANDWLAWRKGADLCSLPRKHKKSRPMKTGAVLPMVSRAACLWFQGQRLNIKPILTLNYSLSNWFLLSSKVSLPMVSGVHIVTICYRYEKLIVNRKIHPARTSVGQFWYLIKLNQTWTIALLWVDCFAHTLLGCVSIKQWSLRHAIRHMLHATHRRYWFNYLLLWYSFQQSRFWNSTVFGTVPFLEQYRFWDCPVFGTVPKTVRLDIE